MTANQQAMTWQKSSRCADTNCVEVGPTSEVVYLRNSADGAGPVLAFDRAAWLDFIEAIKHAGLRP
jgi:hypothetical protein